jgi:hypothetical protein
MSKSKFLGETKGNRDLKTNRSAGGGGSGESHKGGAGLGGKFAGVTKGNSYLPPDRTGKGGK